MGLSSSKRNGAASSSPASSSSSAFSQRTRSYSSRVLDYSCFRSYPQVSDGPTPGRSGHGQSANKSKTIPNEDNYESCGRVKVQQPGGITYLSPEMEHESGRVRTGCMSFEELKPCTNFLSRFNCLSGNVSFMMRRRNSFGSSRPYISPATRSETLNNELEPSTSEVVSSGDVFSRCSASESTRSLDEELATYNLRKGKSKKGQRRVRVGAGVECDENLGSRSHVYTEGFESRIADRCIPGEIIESNARFSRTLSVGRLRDRGLHRMPFPDITSSHQDRDATQNGERNDLDGGMGKMTSEENRFRARNSSSEAGPSRSLHGTRNSVADSSPPPREVQYHHPLEYRSRFLERRRRIRSQVRALQRIGSQFENISGHEMTCILSGQHQRGHCTCNVTLSDQNNKSNGGPNVSRIVMLAEALFEVLDEIHQQSLALSSQPALSSIGSVPAPADVVELLPVRSCSEVQKNFQDDAAQCYICLVDYDQGDSLRILPCHHNFHKACIDKWLKEIHRVCPLCRGDVCKSDKLRVADT